MKLIKSKATYYSMIILCLLIMSIFSLFYYRMKIHETIQDKSSLDLQRYSNQSVELFNYVSEDYFQQLEVLSSLSAYVSQESKSQLMDLVKRVNQENPYLNFSLISKEGLLYDGTNVVDVHEEAYFLRAIQGEKVLNHVYEDEKSQQEVLLLASPIYKEEHVDGVAIARYEITAFMALIGNSQFNGDGATMLMTKDGSLICGDQDTKGYATLYDALQSNDFEYEHAIEDMKHNVSMGNSGFLSYQKDGKDCYLYYEPIGKEDWYIVSVVMAEGLYLQYEEIANISYAIIFMNILLYMIVLILIYLTYREIRRIFRANQRDPLTHTYNKVSAKALSERYLKNSEDTSIHACFFLDIDNFKAINDTYGHKRGDEIILFCSEMLTSNFRRSDVVSRFGGDEFFILMRDVKDEDYIRLKAQNLLNHFANNPYHATLSIGIAFYPKDGTTYEELLHHADQALYQAKSKGKHTFAFYQEEEKTTM